MAEATTPVTGISLDETDAGPGRARLIAYGEFDHDTCAQISTAVLAASDAGRDTVALDLSRVTFIDAATITTLLVCRGHLAVRGGSLDLLNPTGVVARVLDLTGIARQPGSRPAAGTPTPAPHSPAQPLRDGLWLHGARPPGVAEVTETSATLMERAKALVAETYCILAPLRR